jgi:putative aldouronate transport system permease protein
MNRESISDKVFQFVITFFLCIVAVITLVPLLTVLAMSFSSKSAVDANMVSIWPVGFTFASWKCILTNSDLWRSFGITLVSAISGAFLALLFTSMMAYPLSKKEFKPGAVIMLGVVITMIFKAPIVPYFLALKSYGLYNNLLVLVLPFVLSAYNLAIMRTFFKQFPVEIEEAAMIEGCGPFRLLFKVVLPSSSAVLATLGLFYAVAIWNQFQTPLMFIQDVKLFPLQLKIRQLIDDDNQLISISPLLANTNYNIRTLRTATVVFAIAPIIAVYPYLQKYFSKGAMLGSVKG